MLRKVIIIVVSIAAALLAGCQSPPEDNSAVEVARNVRIMPLQTAPVTQYLELAGPIVPVRGAEISSEESGTIAGISHDKGERIDDQGVVLTLDRRLLTAELDASEALLELRLYSHERKRQLREAGKVSELELLQSAAELAAARSQRDVARTRYDRSAVKAPFAGIVSDRYVEPGVYVLLAIL